MVLVAYATAGWFQVGLDVLLQSALGYWAQIRSGTIIHDGGSWSGWDWDCVWGWDCGGAMWVLMWWSWVGGYSVFWDTGVVSVSLPVLGQRHSASCPILSSILLGTIQIVPSSVSGPCGHSFMGSVTSV